jgi:hypothetical protein
MSRYSTLKTQWFISMAIANDVIRSAERLIADVSNVRWEIPALVQWINAGQRFIAKIAPDAKPVYSDASLVAGVDQSLPDTVVQVWTISHNTLSGLPLTRVDEELLDLSDPGWRVGAQDNNAVHYLRDSTDVNTFRVYPPNTGIGSVHYRASLRPADCIDENDVLDIHDKYADALAAFVAFRCYSEDSITGNAEKAKEFYIQFKELVGADMSMTAARSA